MLPEASTTITNEKTTVDFPSPIIQKLSPVTPIQPMPDTTEEVALTQRVVTKPQMKVRISTPPTHESTTEAVTTEGTVTEDTSEGTVTEGSSEGANRSSSATQMAELMGPSTAPASPQVIIMREEQEQQRCNSPTGVVSPNTRIKKLECEKARSSERVIDLEKENAELKLKLQEATMKDLLKGVLDTCETDYQQHDLLTKLTRLEKEVETLRKERDHYTDVEKSWRSTPRSNGVAKLSPRSMEQGPPYSARDYVNSDYQEEWKKQGREGRRERKGSLGTLAPSFTVSTADSILTPRNSTDVIDGHGMNVDTRKSSKGLSASAAPYNPTAHTYGVSIPKHPTIGNVPKPPTPPGAAASASTMGTLKYLQNQEKTLYEKQALLNEQQLRLSQQMNVTPLGTPQALVLNSRRRELNQYQLVLTQQLSVLEKERAQQQIVASHQQSHQQHRELQTVSSHSSGAIAIPRTPTNSTQSNMESSMGSNASLSNGYQRTSFQMQLAAQLSASQQLAAQLSASHKMQPQNSAASFQPSSSYPVLGVPSNSAILHQDSATRSSTGSLQPQVSTTSSGQHLYVYPPSGNGGWVMMPEHAHVLASHPSIPEREEQNYGSSTNSWSNADEQKLHDKLKAHSEEQTNKEKDEERMREQLKAQLQAQLEKHMLMQSVQAHEARAAGVASRGASRGRKNTEEESFTSTTRSQGTSVDKDGMSGSSSAGDRVRDRRVLSDATSDAFSPEVTKNILKMMDTESEGASKAEVESLSEPFPNTITEEFNGTNTDTHSHTGSTNNETGSTSHISGNSSGYRSGSSGNSPELNPVPEEREVAPLAQQPKSVWDVAIRDAMNSQPSATPSVSGSASTRSLSSPEKKRRSPPPPPTSAPPPPPGLLSGNMSGNMSGVPFSDDASSVSSRDQAPRVPYNPVGVPAGSVWGAPRTPSNGTWGAPKMTTAVTTPPPVNTSAHTSAPMSTQPVQNQRPGFIQPPPPKDLTSNDVENRDRLIGLCERLGVEKRTIEWFTSPVYAHLWIQMINKIDELNRRQGGAVNVKNPAAWLTKFFNIIRVDPDEPNRNRMNRGYAGGYGSGSGGQQGGVGQGGYNGGRYGGGVGVGGSKRWLNGGNSADSGDGSDRMGKKSMSGW